MEIRFKNKNNAVIFLGSF